MGLFSKFNTCLNQKWSFNVIYKISRKFVDIHFILLYPPNSLFKSIEIKQDVTEKSQVPHIIALFKISMKTPVVAQEHKRAKGNTTGCGFDCHSKKLNIKYFHYLELVTGQRRCSVPINTQCLQNLAKRITECLKSRFPLPAMLCVRYRVKLIKNCIKRRQLKHLFDYNKIPTTLLLL